MMEQVDICEDSLPSETYFVEFKDLEATQKPLKLPQLYDETRSTFHTTGGRNRNVVTPELPPTVNKNEFLDSLGNKATETNRCLGKPKQINRTLNMIYKRSRIQVPNREPFQENQYSMTGYNRWQRPIPKRTYQDMDQVIQPIQKNQWNKAQRTILSLKALLT